MQKNHLFIGLGGQGGRSLGDLRKVMAQRAKDTKTLRQQGVRTGFLAIDSSDDVRNQKRTWTDFGIDLALNPSDWLILKRPGAGTIGGLALRPDVSPWIGDPKRIQGFLGQQQIPGANQRRRFGRLLCAHNAATIRSAVIEKVNQVTSGQAYQCAFHIFATLGGGTGSGGLIDLVTLIRTKFPHNGADEFPIFIYVYITDADEKGANVGYFFQNQFTALRDLNALIVGRFRPTLLGDDIHTSAFNGAEPIAQVALSAPLNSAGRQMSLENQIRVVAEACFERIVAWSSGQMDTDALKSLTGEDILAVFPAEPPELPERSYRFSALGMRRWEVPHDKLKDLLALDLLRASLRQMLFNHWNDATGFSTQLADGSAANAANAVPDLFAEIEEPRRPEPDPGSLGRRLRDALARKAVGLQRAQGTAPLDLRSIEQGLADFYRQSFEKVGIDALMQQRQAELPTRVEDAVRRIETRLTGLWLEKSNPLALARISQVLDEFATRLRRDIEPSAKDNAGEERRRRIIDARRFEWTKLTWLSGRMTSKRSALIAAHGDDCAWLHAADLHARLGQSDRAFINALLGRLANIKNRFQSVQLALQQFLNAVEDERDLLDRELRDLHHDAASNKYEFEPDSLDAFLTWMSRHRTHQDNAAYLMRDEISRAVGTSQPLSAFDSRVLASVDDLLRRVAKEQATQIHQDYETNRHGQPILEDSVLDILRVRHDADHTAFLNELQNFLQQAAVALHLRNDIQPSQLHGAGIGVSRMPRRLLQIGLPRHAFTQTLQQAFQTAMPPGDSHLLNVFEHEDPGQIRLLTVDYWLAARFATVVKALGDKYQDTAARAHNPETIYFCNIDPDGEENRRPDLFLPDDETMRLRYEAELWLGQQEKIDIVQVDQNGVFLIRKDADGQHVERLGATLEAAIANPDYSKMFMLHGRLGQVLAGIDSTEFKGLLNEQRAAMRQEHGNSPNYQRWDRMLMLLKPLVD
jgi:hypothetical protein